MKNFLQRAKLAPSWLIALGALAIGLTLGRYLLPSAENEQSGTSSEKAPSVESSRKTSTGSQNSLPFRKREREITSRSNSGAEANHAALADILNEGNQLSRTRAMLDFIDHLDNQAIEEVVADFRESGWVDFNRGEYSMLISAWMERTPFDALTYLDQNDADGWTRKTAIAAWAAEDPAAAANAIQGLEDAGLVNDWVAGLIEGVARNDPNAALSLMSGTAGNETNLHALRGVIPEVAIRGPEFATDWISQITDPKLKNAAAKRLAATMGRRDPVAASEWINTLESPEIRRDASGVVAEVYAREDLDGAKAWVLELPNDSVGVAASNVARHLTRKSPTEAALWLRQLGDNPSLDNARIRFLQEAGRQDPETALEHVPTLSTARDQEKHYRDILSQWRKRDQKAAIAWASANSESIPPKVLRTIIPRQR